MITHLKSNLTIPQFHYRPGVHARVWTTIELVDTLLSPTLLPTMPTTSHHHDNKKSTGTITEPSMVEQDQIASSWIDVPQTATAMVTAFSSSKLIFLVTDIYLPCICGSTKTIANLFNTTHTRSTPLTPPLPPPIHTRYPTHTGKQ